MRGSIQLGDLNGSVAVLEVACGRHGRYHLSRLIERHGAAMTLPDFVTMLSGDCPESKNHKYTEPSNFVSVYFEVKTMIKLSNLADIATILMLIIVVVQMI